MTPLPAKYQRLLRDQVAPSTQHAADYREAADLAVWALHHGRCIMPTHRGLCLHHRDGRGLLCNGCRRIEA